MKNQEFIDARNQLEFRVEAAKQRLLIELREPKVDYEKVAIADENLRDAINALMALTAAQANESV